MEKFLEKRPRRTTTAPRRLLRKPSRQLRSRLRARPIPYYRRPRVRLSLIRYLRLLRSGALVNGNRVFYTITFCYTFFDV
jgi:hypothetical protein